MPRRKSSWADELVLAPWWVSALLALLAYTLLPGLLPRPLVNGGLVTMVTIFFVAISSISALRSLRTRFSLERQTSLQSLRNLSWKSFEDLLAEAYRRQGYSVTEMLGAGADGGVDLVLRKGQAITVVQCKRWKGKPVPVQTVRELYGVMMDRGAWAAKIVATTTFTPDAMAFAQNKPIELVDGQTLLQLIRSVQHSKRVTLPSNEPDHLTPACPNCGATMVLREARRGPRPGEKFWGCPSYPRCRGTRPL